ncbi:hypothetical protein VTO42DRAFT_5953 [Malbranchea cinnamomea]
MEAHARAVAQIASAIRAFHRSKTPFRISHGSTNSTRPQQHKQNVLDISALRNVVHIDTEKRTALVEPNVPMDRLVEATLKHGLIPPVVMEFPGITVGGGYAGTAGESSSFRHGFFDRTIASVEIVKADGEVVVARPGEDVRSGEGYADLFHGAAGALGTLGTTTLVELRLVKARKFVRTTYHPQRSVGDAIENVGKQTGNEKNDYVDGILFSKEHGVVVTGEMTDDLPPNKQVQTFSDPWDPWFYLHAREKTKNATGPVTDIIPLAEYLFRYDRGGFWVGKSAFDYFKFPFNKLTRWWLDDFLHTRMLYRALHASGESKRYIVQDLALPYSTAEEFINYTAARFGIWPLWLCPLKESPQPTMHPHSRSKETTASHGKYPCGQMLNIGVWGFGPANLDEFVEANRDLERRLQELGGMKWLYAHTYYTEDEFWQNFDRDWYEGLRQKYNATSLPSVYDKVKIDVEADRREMAQSWGRWLRSLWPLGGMYGIRKAIQSRDYYIARNSTWKWKKTC